MSSSDIVDELPPWVPPFAILMLALLVISGVGVLLLERLDTPPAPEPTPQALVVPKTQPTAIPLPTATPLPPDFLPLGEVAELRFTEEQDEHTLTILGQADTLLAAEVYTHSGRVSRLSLSLFNTAGRLVAVSDSFEYGLLVPLYESGLYTLKVSPPASLEDTIGVRVFIPHPLDVPPSQRDDITAWQTIDQERTLTPGESVSGVIEKPYQTHEWLIPEQINQPVRLVVTGNVRFDTRTDPDRLNRTSHDDVWVNRKDRILRIIPMGGVGENIAYSVRLEPVDNYAYDISAQDSYMLGHTFPTRAHATLKGGQFTVVRSPGGVSLEMLTPTDETLQPVTTLTLEGDRYDIFEAPADGSYTITHAPAPLTIEYPWAGVVWGGSADLSAPPSLSIGQTVEAHIVERQTHTIPLEVDAGTRVALDLAYIYGTQPKINVVAPDGTRLVDWETMAGWPPRVVFTAPRTATYTVEVIAPMSQYSWATGYTLTAEITDPYEPVTMYAESFTNVLSQTLAPEETVTRRLERADYSHEYTVQTGGQRVTVEIIGIGDTVPCIIVISCYPNLDGEPIVRTINEDETIRVGAYEGQAGSYAIRTYLGNPPVLYPADAIPLPINQRTEAHEAGYLFEAEEGQQLYIAIYLTEPDLGFLPRVRDPENDIFDLERGPQYYSYQVSRSGTHHLTFPHADHLGYEVELRTAPDLTIQPQPALEIGQIVFNGLENEYVSHTYPLEVTPGQLHTLWVEDPGLNRMRFTIYKDNGTNREDDIIASTQKDEALRFIPEANTRYYAKVIRYNTASSGRPLFSRNGNLDYNLRLEEGVGFTITQTRNFAQIEQTSSFISAPFEAHRWLFYASEADERIRFTLSHDHLDVIVVTTSGNIITPTVIEYHDRSQGKIDHFVVSIDQPGLYAIYIYHEDSEAGLYTFQHHRRPTD